MPSLHISDALARDGVLNIFLAMFGCVFELLALVGMSSLIPGFFLRLFFCSAIVSNLYFVYSPGTIWASPSATAVQLFIECCVATEAAFIMYLPSRSPRKSRLDRLTCILVGLILTGVFLVSGPEIYPGVGRTMFTAFCSSQLFCAGVVLYAAVDSSGWKGFPSHRENAVTLLLWFGGTSYANLFIKPESWFYANGAKLLIHALCALWWFKITLDLAAVSAATPVSRSCPGLPSGVYVKRI